MSDKSGRLTVGVVGLGGMGRNHARGAQSFGAEVAGGADVVEETRLQFADDFDATPFADHERMYDRVEPDAVFVCTPNAFHAPAAVAALERDIPVLVEKPVADTLENAERVRAAAAESSAFCMVGFHNRFCPAADLFREFDRQGRFGDVHHVEAEYVRRRGIPGTGSWFTTKDLSGGGALIDLGVHLIDFALYLAGYPDVTEVSGVARTVFGTDPAYADPDGWNDNWDREDSTFDVDDSASAFLRCADGTTVSVEVAWASNRESSKDVTVRGTDAGATMTLGGDTLSVNETGSNPHDHYVDAEYTGGDSPTGQVAEDAAFLGAVAEGTVPEQNTLEEGLTVQRVLDAIYRSSERGSAVSLE